MPRNHGRVGNEGFSYFSETAFKNLEKAIQKLEQYNRLQQQMTKASAEQYQNMYITADKYAKELKDMGIDINSNLGALKRQYETEKEIYDLRVKERKAKEEADRLVEFNKQKKLKLEEKDKILNETRAKFNRLIADDTKEHIAQQERLYRLQERAVKESADENKNAKEKAEAMKKYVDLYNKLDNKIKNARAIEKRDEGIKNAKQNFIENGVGSLFGTNSQAIQDIKDGTYWWKFGTKVFSEAVTQFKNAINEGINTNYNSTEKTLNRITASNRMSWSSGKFNLGDNTYIGYHNINNAINDKLWQEGLYDNIKNTDVMEATAELTSTKGFGMDKNKVSITALDKAYQDTVIKYIVPYLDTANEAFEMLEMTIPRNVKKCGSYKYNFQRTIW